MIRRYNIWEEDLDHAVVLYQATYLSPEIIQHKAYLTLRGVKHIDEGNEFE